MFVFSSARESDGRDEERQAPAVLLADAGLRAHEGVDTDHEHLRHAAAQVAPARRRRVRRADNVVCAVGFVAPRRARLFSGGGRRPTPRCVGARAASPGAP